MYHSSQNHDRVSVIWPEVSSHMSSLIVSSAASCSEGGGSNGGGSSKLFLLERSVTALLRLAIRLARKEELASTVVQSMAVLQTLKSPSLFLVCRHTAFGLHEVRKLIKGAA